MKNLMKLFGLLTTFLLISCTNGNPPKNIAQEAAESLQNQNYEKLVEMIYEGSDCTAAEKARTLCLLEEKVSKSYESKGGIKSYRIGEERINEETGTAIVIVEFTFGNGKIKRERMNFAQHDKKWHLTLF